MNTTTYQLTDSQDRQVSIRVFACKLGGFRVGTSALRAGTFCEDEAAVDSRIARILAS